MTADLRTRWPHYFSTYCIHGHHDDCRLTCKVCGEQCLCECHEIRRKGNDYDEGDYRPGDCKHDIPVEQCTICNGRDQTELDDEKGD